MQVRYAVMNKATNKMFAGFDTEGNPIWTSRESKAKSYMEKSAAHGQALLFACFGIKAQQKPVVMQ